MWQIAGELWCTIDLLHWDCATKMCWLNTYTCKLLFNWTFETVTGDPVK